MKEIFTSPLAMLTLTLGVYYGSLWLYRRVRFPLLHPLLVSIALIITILRLGGISYEAYAEATTIIDMMLGPSIVALGYLLYKQAAHIKGNTVTIFTSVTVGAAISILSVVIIARMMGADHTITSSLAPKSATTAIALSISGNSGGIPAVTSVVVIIVGIFGGIIGPSVLRILGVKNELAQGLALGSAAHAMGTARAIEMGSVQGAVGGLAIAIMGIMTAVLVPVFDKIL